MPLIVVSRHRNALLGKGYVSCLDGDEWFNTDNEEHFDWVKKKITVAEKPVTILKQNYFLF
jgi:hypothetical protein